jgi:hypothetical protein
MLLKIFCSFWEFFARFAFVDDLREKLTDVFTIVNSVRAARARTAQISRE